MVKAIVIGAGIAGLASAIRLANKGYKVDVFESNSYPGGKLTEVKLGAYRFDAGPSLFTMPNLVDELFELSGRKAKDHFEYSRLDEICRYFYEDGTSFIAHADTEKLATVLDEPIEMVRARKSELLTYTSLWNQSRFSATVHKVHPLVSPISSFRL